MCSHDLTRQNVRIVDTCITLPVPCLWLISHCTRTPQLVNRFTSSSVFFSSSGLWFHVFLIVVAVDDRQGKQQLAFALLWSEF